MRVKDVQNAVLALLEAKLREAEQSTGMYVTRETVLTEIRAEVIALFSSKTKKS